MTVFVTGASGHIGANLVRELIRRKRPVRALVYKDTRGVEGLDIDIIKGDILDYPGLVKAMEGCDAVYHLAARISIIGDKQGTVRRINVTGTRNIIKACFKCGIKRLIHFSSIHAYCPFPPDQPVDETRSFSDFRSPAYDCSKADSTREVLEAVKKGLDPVVISPTAVIGPNDFKPSRMGQVIVKLHNRKFIALIKGGYDWVDARDIVKGALLAEEKAEAGSQFILSGHRASLREIAEMVKEISGIKPPRFTAPMWLARIAAPISETAALLCQRNALLTSESLRALRTHKVISRRRAEEQLGYNPRPLKVTIRDTIEWLEKKGLLL